VGWPAHVIWEPSGVGPPKTLDLTGAISVYGMNGEDRRAK